MLEQVDDEPAEILALLGELLEEDERAGGVAVDDQVAEPEQHLVLDRAEQLQDVLHGDRAAGRGGELVERRARRRGTRRAPPRAISASAASGTSISSPSAISAQLAHEVGQPRPLEDERLAARAHGRQHLLQLGRAEDEQQVRRRLLDQLQQRVPRGVGELVRLVEDVDLRLPSTGCSTTRSRISRMSSIPRCDAASISITSSEVPFAIATHAWQVLSGVGVGPCAQLTAFARMRASDVLPVPRGPAKR